ncbi:glycosyltransferase family 2 protein [Citricoccus sp.]|uniref:glycosyltransferase n=1 Tax=Citricoccus sp. TaxID=1978372 RepID=UPI0028BF15F0|nr:glycosyltransferase family 2 protein [Citricoccus sp.]
MTEPAAARPAVTGWPVEVIPSAPHPPVDIIVAIPAHDEELLLPGCLDHVAAAVTWARAIGAVDRAVIAVAAHRCADRTAQVARARLTDAEPDVEWIVIEDRASATVAEVRRTAVDAAVPLLGQSSSAWLFNTDADSLVPADWISSSLAVATADEADAVAGLVDLLDWNPPAAARHAYELLVTRGIHSAGHDHAYGANLVVRLDAYQTVGGFTPRSHGEDHDLLRRLGAARFRVATPMFPRVSTSGREDPRCADGLGSLLRRLAESSDAG